MTTTVDYVDARFNGADVRFRLTPERIEAVESIGGSLYALMRTFAAGNWRLADLRKVLTWGFPGGSRWLEGGPIEAAIADNRPATYAPLALAILAAALTGLPPEAAKFSDEEANDD